MEVFMKIGIIIHSHTGHTQFVANKIKEKLIELNHDVSVEQVVAYNEEPSQARNTTLKIIPSIKDYQLIIFGLPVRGFALSPIMELYLKQLSLDNRNVICYVTQSFPYAWMGGNQAILQLKKILTEKNALVIETGIINWSNRKKAQMIKDLINRVVMHIK
jgi:flavodoxin